MPAGDRYLWWAMLFDGWLTTDTRNGYGDGRGRQTYGQ
jgi:hypothetical protein